jgi:hypothetical protein
MSRIEEIMEAYTGGMDEETIMRVFDLTGFELTCIILSY